MKKNLFKIFKNTCDEDAFMKRCAKLNNKEINDLIAAMKFYNINISKSKCDSRMLRINIIDNNNYFCHNIEEIVSLLLNFFPNDPTFNKLQKKFEKAYSKGKVINSKTFYLTGYGQWQEEPYNGVAPGYVFASCNNIFKADGKLEPIIKSDSTYYYTKNNKYERDNTIQTVSTFIDEDFLYKSCNEETLRVLHGCYPGKCIVCEKDNGVVQVKIYENYICRPINKNKVYLTKEKYFMQLSFNVKTGDTYCVSFNIGKNKQRHALCDMNFRKLSALTAPSSFCPIGEFPDIINYIKELIQKEKTKQYGFTPAFYVCHNNPVQSLIAYNRNPLCNPLEFVKKDLTKGLYNKIKNSANPCDEFIKLLDFPCNKTTHKIFFENPIILLHIYFLKHSEEQIFINTLNIAELYSLLTLPDNSIFKHLVYYNYSYNYIVNNYFGLRGINKQKKYIYKPQVNPNFCYYCDHLKKTYNNNTTKIVNKLCQSSYECADIIRMLRSLESKKGINFRSKKIPFKSRKEYDDFIYKSYTKEFTKMRHDKITSLYNLLNNKNQTIPLTKHEKSLAKTIGNYSFVVPNNTHELNSIGRNMNICVGCYDSLAVNKNLLIVALYKEDQPLVCMEIRHDNYVKQVKGLHNSLIAQKSPEGKLIYEWLQDHDLTSTIDFVGPQIKEIRPKNLLENGEFIRLKAKLDKKPKTSACLDVPFA